MRGRLALPFLAGILSSSGALAGSALPQIAAVPVDGGLRLEASVLGLDPGEVTATFEIEREENGNRMRSSQSTTFPVTVGERHIVAHTTLSLDIGSRLDASLFLENNGQALGDARLTLGSDR